MVADISKYAGREQAYVKHYFLESYLERLIHKTAARYDHVVYVDGFSGPWQSTGEGFADTSFGIALSALRKAKATWKPQRDVRMSAYLVERTAKAYRELDAIKPRYPDIEIHTYNSEFVSTAPQLLREIPRNAFAFFFIDPKGWRIDLQQLAPLLSRQHSEVVFNFMFEFINRAASIDDPNIIAGLNALMPHGGDWRAKLGGPPQSRMMVLAEAFRETLLRIGNYDYVAEIPVLRPVKDRTLYALFYGTRHREGIKVFRDCHVKTELEQASVRGATKRADREAKSQQLEFLGVSEQTEAHTVSSYFDAECAAAKAMLVALVPEKLGRTTYKDIWPQILAKHAVRLKTVNELAASLRREGVLSFPDWQSGKRVPADDYRIFRKATEQA